MSTPPLKPRIFWPSFIPGSGNDPFAIWGATNGTPVVLTGGQIAANPAGAYWWEGWGGVPPPSNIVAPASTWGLEQNRFDPLLDPPRTLFRETIPIGPDDNDPIAGTEGFTGDGTQYAPNTPWTGRNWQMGWGTGDVLKHGIPLYCVQEQNMPSWHPIGPNVTVTIPNNYQVVDGRSMTGAQFPFKSRSPFNFGLPVYAWDATPDDHFIWLQCSGFTFLNKNQLPPLDPRFPISDDPYIWGNWIYGICSPGTKLNAALIPFGNRSVAVKYGNETVWDLSGTICVTSYEYRPFCETSTDEAGRTIVVADSICEMRWWGYVKIPVADPIIPRQDFPISGGRINNSSTCAFSLGGQIFWQDGSIADPNSIAIDEHTNFYPGTNLEYWPKPGLKGVLPAPKGTITSDDQYLKVSAQGIWLSDSAGLGIFDYGSLPEVRWFNGVSWLTQGAWGIMADLTGWYHNICIAPPEWICYQQGF